VQAQDQSRSGVREPFRGGYFIGYAAGELTIGNNLVGWSVQDIREVSNPCLDSRK
jgi:hypothetical protein